MDSDVSLIGLALGGLSVAALASAVLRMVLPAASRYLGILCEAPHRGRFWTRLLAAAMAGAVVIGAMAAHMASGSLHRHSDSPGLRHVWTVSAMLAGAVASAAVVLGVLVMATLVFESRNDPQDLR